MFRSIYMKMNQLIQVLGLTFIVINQITSYYTDSADILSKRLGHPVIPALGNTVTQFTHNRYMMCRRNETYPAITIADIDSYVSVMDENQSGTPSEQVRDFYVIFSPALGERKTSFTVTIDGVVPICLVCNKTRNSFSSVSMSVASLGLIT